MSTHQVAALVDTGAFASFVDSRNLSKEAIAQADTLQRINVSLADGSSVRTMGTLMITVSLGALVVDVMVHVMPTLNKALILGMDFLGRRDLDPAILTARRVLKFCATGQEVPLGRHGVPCSNVEPGGTLAGVTDFTVKPVERVVCKARSWTKVAVRLPPGLDHEDMVLLDEIQPGANLAAIAFT